jgi:hypothetical protein
MLNYSDLKTILLSSTQMLLKMQKAFGRTTQTQ